MGTEGEVVLVDRPDTVPVSPAEAIEAVRAAVGSWEHVTTDTGRFGAIAFFLGRRELGHLHGSIADLPVPRRVRDRLVAAGHARPHHVVPESGWITVPMCTVADVTRLIRIFRSNYERSWDTLDGGGTA